VEFSGVNVFRDIEKTESESDSRASKEGMSINEKGGFISKLKVKLYYTQR